MPSAQEPTLVGHTIEHGRLKLIDVIGKGAFGIVYLAYDTRPSTSQDGPRYFAVKSMSKARLAINPRSIEDYMRETSLHRYASQHPNIVSLHRVFDEVVDGQELSFMIMDYYPGDLFAQITRKRAFTCSYSPTEMSHTDNISFPFPSRCVLYISARTQIVMLEMTNLFARCFYKSSTPWRIVTRLVSPTVTSSLKMCYARTTGWRSPLQTLDLRLWIKRAVIPALVVRTIWHQVIYPRF